MLVPVLGADPDGPVLVGALTTVAGEVCSTEVSGVGRVGAG